MLNLSCANQEVFSLSEEDFGLSDCMYHSIPTTTDKPIYLPHRRIPQQLQHEVCDFLDKWLKQGAIRPSSSPYDLQVVIVKKKTGKVRLCVDYLKLNLAVICNAFPCHTLMMLHSQYAIVNSIYPLTLHRDIFRCQCKRSMCKKLLSGLGHLDYINSPRCPLDCQTQIPASVT